MIGNSLFLAAKSHQTSVARFQRAILGESKGLHTSNGISGFLKISLNCRNFCHITSQFSVPVIALLVVEEMSFKKENLS